MAEVVTIETIGHRGDGIARGPEGPVYVPFALPGERVAIERRGERGRLVEVIEPSVDRTAPPCRHFGVCGGCALQMMPLAASRRWKHELVVAALAQRQLQTQVAETVGVSPASRRRTVLTAIRAGRRLVLGYHERLTNRVVDVEECPILAQPLAERLDDLRAVLDLLVPAQRPVRVTALVTCGGLDVNVEGAPLPGPRLLPELAERARTSDVARLGLAGEPILVNAEPIVDIAGVPVVPPPGAFVQASAEAEAIMAGLVVEHLAEARHTADLFCGIGTFTLGLARQAPVRAVEASRAALDALQSALRRVSGLKRVETERRDLFSFPLGSAELDGFDGVVFDPPRGGARAQAEALAASKVARIVAVSCNPASFARDARILVDGGYVLERVVPVDQFVYSAETEVVGCFRRSV